MDGAPPRRLAAAREAVRRLEERATTLAWPALLTLARSAANNPPAAHALHQQLLARNLPASERAWVLFIDAEAFRAEKALDDARKQYDLARQSDPVSPLGRLASFRVAQMNLELHRFAQALAEARTLLAQPLAPELRAPVLLLAGEAAYYGREYEAAAAMFGSFLGEFPTHASVPAARLSLGWAELKRGRDAEARRIFSDFVRDLATDPAAPEALLLASELAAAAGNPGVALQGFGLVIRQYPNHRTSELAHLNGAILLLRTERIAAAQPELRAFLKRAPDSPLAPRARLALGVVLLAAGQPSQASHEFAAAEDGGEGALATLGKGVTHLLENRLPEAVRDFAAARDGGTPSIVAAAKYGLAILDLRRGVTDEFKKHAVAVLNASPNDATAPTLLEGLSSIAVEERDWREALSLARRLLAESPATSPAEAALHRIGAAARRHRTWIVASEAYSLLLRYFPTGRFADEARAAFTEADRKGRGKEVANAPMAIPAVPPKVAPDSPAATRRPPPEPLSIAINYPPADANVTQDRIVIVGLVNGDVALVQVTVNGVLVPLSRDLGIIGKAYRIRLPISLRPGGNVIEVTATDKAGHVAQVIRAITLAVPATGPKPPAPRTSFPSPRRSPQPADHTLKLDSTGTGFIVSGQGHVLTNSHVVEDCRAVHARGANRDNASGVIVVSDSRNDLALVRVDGSVSPTATFREGRGPRQGDAVVAIGFPLRGLLASGINVTTGMISALAGLRDDTRYLEITAPVQPGNSGGPLLDESGNVVGVIVGKLNALRLAELTGDIPQNINFAINSSVARLFLDANGVDYKAATSQRPLTTADIAERAKRFTVVFECWK